MIVGPPTLLNCPPFAKLWPRSSPVIDLVFKRRKLSLGMESWVSGLSEAFLRPRQYLRNPASACWVCLLISTLGSMDFKGVRDVNGNSSKDRSPHRCSHIHSFTEGVLRHREVQHTAAVPSEVSERGRLSPTRLAARAPSEVLTISPHVHVPRSSLQSPCTVAVQPPSISAKRKAF